MTTTELQQTVERVNTWFADRFDRLRRLADAMLASLDLDADRHVALPESAKRRLRSVAERYLSENAVVDGCGLIFAHSALGTENGHLEWWVREEESRFARYSFGVVPGGDRYYDYDHHEWFMRAFEEGVAALVGPYIDYLGVEEYVVTLTIPAEVGERRIGAIGNDIQVRDLESELLPELFHADRDLALIGAHGHVLVSTSSRWLPGAHVPREATGVSRIPVGPESTRVHLLVAD